MTHFRIERLENRLFLFAPIGMAGDLVPDIDTVLVAEGETLSVDYGSSLQLGEVQVAGTLIVNGRVNVQTLFVTATGTLMVNSGAVIEIIDAPIDTSRDPQQIGNGVLVAGAIDVNGTAKTPFARSVGDLFAGATHIDLETVPDGWAVGDLLSFADTRQIDYEGRTDTLMEPVINSERNEEHVRSFARRPEEWQHETAEIAEIEGGRVVLATPLRFDHRGVSGQYVHVGNLTRDVVFRSEDPDGVRGHLIAFHSASVSIVGAEFDGFGRTTVDVIDNGRADVATQQVQHVGANQNGRYAIHMHHVGAGAEIIGNAIRSSPRWGVALHNTSYSTVSDNAIWQAAGAGIVFEDGSEVGNVVTGNYSAAAVGSGERIDSRDKASTDKGHEGTGFWFRGVHEAVIEGNVAEGNYHSGFAVFQFPPPSLLQTLLTMPNGDEISSRDLKDYAQVKSFAQNVAGATRRGFEVWNHNNPTTFEGLTAYATSEIGFATFYVENMDLRSSEFYADAAIASGIGVAHEGTEGAGNMHLTNVNVSGFGVGVRLVPVSGESVIDRVTIVDSTVGILRRNSKGEDNVTVRIIDSAFERLALDWQGRWHWKVESILRRDETLVDQRRVYFEEQSAEWGPVPQTAIKELPRFPEGVIRFEGAPEPDLKNEDLIAAGLPPVAGELLPKNVEAAPWLSGGKIDRPT